MFSYNENRNSHDVVEIERGITICGFSFHVVCSDVDMVLMVVSVLFPSYISSRMNFSWFINIREPIKKFTVTLDVLVVINWL